MELVPSICLSSLAGAIFFFTGGRFSARRPAATPIAETALEREKRAEAEAEAERARAEVERARAEAERARAEAEIALGEAHRARSEVAGARGEVERARVDAERARGEAERRIGEAERRIGEAERRIGEARAAREGAEQRAASLDRDLAKARAEIGPAVDANKRLATEVAELRARAPRLAAAEARAGEADRLRAENTALKAAHTAMERERKAAPDPAELQKRSVEMSLTARALAQRAAELDRREAENAELRARIDDLTARAGEAEELRRRVIELEAQGFARRLEEPAPPSRPPPEGASLATILERELGRLVDREEGCRMAVLADPRGLLIAASPGASYPHEIAAASSLTTYASDRLRELLPLSAPASLELYDENGLAMRTRWLRFEDECFLVSTVGVVDPHDAEAEMLRARIGEIIGS